jgi:hypothetical protein
LRLGLAEALAREPSQAPAGPAVVELFTSEGCSSCPAAESVFADVVAAARTARAPVVALAFHVDYWDGLGWPDRFASGEFTERQEEYGRAFGDSSLYTPEMVVGGDDHFVGSDRGRAEAALSAALERPAPRRVSLRVERRASDALAVHYEVEGGVPPQAHLFLGVVERAATVHVEAGENAGRTLHHTDIVRSWIEVPAPGASGEARLPAPRDIEAHASDVAAVVQRARGPGGLGVLGAALVEAPAR